MCDKMAQDAYDVKWHPGKENLADYQSKHHTGAHHTAVRPWYLHGHNSLLVLPRASRPSTLKGCVGTLPQGYVRNAPLPRIPLQQSTSTPTSSNQIHTVSDYYEVPQGVPPYGTPRSIVENAAYAFSPAWYAIFINT